MKAVVVGGGIAGLAAARRLEALLRDAEIVLFERDVRLGGKLLTEHVDGYLVEGAADSFLSRKERGIGLCEELGLGGELIGRRPEHARTFVRRGSELHRLPEGLTGMIPTSLAALEDSTLLSPSGRARLAAEVDVPPEPAGGDESIATFVRRRLGEEAYDVLVEPLATGIFGGDGEQLSLAATFPALRELELEHGSVIKGLLAQSAGQEAAEQPPFVALRSGMQALATGAASSLRRARIVTGRGIVAMREARSGYELELEDGAREAADAVVVAVPAPAAAELLGGLDEELAAEHAAVTHASSAIVTLGFDSAGVARRLDGYGYVIPRIDGSEVLACTWSSSKWEGRAPEGHALVRVYAGRAGGRDVTAESDDDLTALALDELRRIGVVDEPTFVRVHRWQDGMPQYVLGHLDRVERIEAALAAHPGLALAGAAYRGVGIPDCIASGEHAAEAVVRSLAAVAR